MDKYFSESYQEARKHFLDAAKFRGAEIKAFAHPLKGRDGEDLAIDLARLGPADAKNALLVLSGTHGIEGYCGSGIQRAWLHEGTLRKRAQNTAVFLIHAVNPYGFSWQRRVNEDNVDLNRNFVDFDQPLPENVGYSELFAALCPKTWDEATIAATQKVLDVYAEEHGSSVLSQVISGGQYDFSDGIFFGGRTPSWSNRTLVGILESQLSHLERLAVVDLHTGLGPEGYGERICDFRKGTKERSWTEEIYGEDITCFYDGTAVSAELSGDIVLGIVNTLSRTLVSPVALEFGTVPRDRVRLAIRSDNWLHLYGDLASEKGRDIKAEMRAAFFPKGRAWCQKVVARSFETFDLALDALKAA